MLHIKAVSRNTGAAAKAAYRAQPVFLMKQQPKSPAYLAQYTCYNFFGSTSQKTMTANVKRNTTNTFLQGYNAERPQIYEIF